MRTLPLILFAMLLTACGGSDHRAPGLAAPDSASPYDLEKVLNVYSWADYIAPDTVANFEKETGIKVRYDTYDNNEVLETKLLTGHTDYDVVIPTENFFDRQLRAGVYRKLDKGALPNLINADPEIMRRLAVHDPGNLYAIPYLWTTTGLAYNVDRVKARLGPSITDSWALLFDPANSEKLKDCGIAVIDSPLEVFQSAMIYLGRDPNRHDAGDIAAASELLRKIRPFIGRISQTSSHPWRTAMCVFHWRGPATWRRAQPCDRGCQGSAHRLLRAARRRAPHARHDGDPRGCPSSAQRAGMDELLAAARGDRRDIQLHQVSERQSGLPPLPRRFHQG